MTEIEWDEALIREAADRRLIIFLGAGATRACRRFVKGADRGPTPSWVELLQALLGRAHIDADARALVQDLFSKERYLDAAQIIRTSLTPQEYAGTVSNEFVGIETGPLHDAIQRLDQRLVMTTNYDTAYEDLCMRGEGRDGYHVLNYYDDGLTNRLRSRTRLILKLHGSVKAPEKTVLARSDYFKARAGHPQFFSIIQSLFVTNTIVFVGYSLSDPDIQLLLENSNLGGDLSYRHYAIVPKGTHVAITKAISESYGINLVEYDSSKGHGIVTESLIRFADRVDEEREALSS